MNRRSFLRIIPVAPIAAPAAALQVGQECLPVTIEVPPPLVVPSVDRLSGVRFYEFVLELAERAGIKVKIEREGQR